MLLRVHLFLFTLSSAKLFDPLFESVPKPLFRHRRSGSGSGYWDSVGVGNYMFKFMGPA
jgi:hypothetical protein